jgi:hypothetical protein
MAGKHRKPTRRGADAPDTATSPGRRARNLAAGAAVITAGALPLAVAGSAFADSPISVPIHATSPLGVNSISDPATGVLPIAGSLTGEATSSLGAADLQNGLTGGLSSAGQTRSARSADDAGAESADLSAKATQLAEQLAASAPVSGLTPPGGVVHEMVPGLSGQPSQLVPSTLQGGAVGTLTNGFGTKGMELTRGVVGKAAPVVAQLKQAGVPTVGDMTTALSHSQVPDLGTVGDVTGAVPVGAMLGNDSPVLGTVGAASGL